LRAEGREELRSARNHKACQLAGTAHLDVARAQVAPADHVKDAAGRAADDVLPIVELLDVLADARAADAGVALNVHVVAQCEDDALDLGSELARRREDERLRFADRGVDRLERRDRKGGCLSGSGLGLSNDVPARDDGQDRPLLDGRRLLEVCAEGARTRSAPVRETDTESEGRTVGIDAAEQVLLQAEGVDCDTARARVGCKWEASGGGGLSEREVSSSAIATPPATSRDYEQEDAHVGA
jgi:hypothetical protein